MSIHPETYSRYAGMQVPRYTSYPTAPHFSPEVGAANYATWLSQAPVDDALSIYIHIPFCREMCWYCGCHTTVVNRRAPIDRYVSSLVSEIRLVAGKLGGGRKASHLHWGGGSPTLLPSSAIALVSSEIGQIFSFEADSEIAVEVDPRTLTKEVAEAFARAGTNRASLGVQSFDPRVQAAINRVQSFETTLSAANLLRRHGIEGINLDLIYGLPLQTVRSCRETIDQALRLRPQRLSIFGYAHVPTFKPHQRRISSVDLPNVEERQQQFGTMASRLVSEGYIKIGLDHFALPQDGLARAAKAGSLRRNFQGYTTDKSNTLLGFGASAIGRLPAGYVQNAVRIPDYERALLAGQFATLRGCPISAEDKQRSAIIEQLMCNFRADVDAVDAPVDELIRDGLVRRIGNVIEVVEEAKPLVRVVAAVFDSRLGTANAKHVTAV